MHEENLVTTIRSFKTRLIVDDTNAIASVWRAASEKGFKYRKIDKKEALMETQRYEYLRAIKEYRSQRRFIIYLDETWFDTHDTPSKG